MSDRVLTAVAVAVAVLATVAAAGVVALRVEMDRRTQRADAAWRALEALTRQRVAAATELAQRRADIPRHVSGPPAPEEMIATGDLQLAAAARLRDSPRSRAELRCFLRMHERFDDAEARLRSVLSSARGIDPPPRVSRIADELAASDEPALTARAAFARAWRARERLAALTPSRVVAVLRHASLGTETTAAPRRDAGDCDDDAIPRAVMLVHRQAQFGAVVGELASVERSAGGDDALIAFRTVTSTADQLTWRLSGLPAPSVLACLDVVGGMLGPPTKRVLDGSRAGSAPSDAVIARYVAAIAETDTKLAHALREAHRVAGESAGACPVAPARAT